LYSPGKRDDSGAGTTHSIDEFFLGIRLSRPVSDRLFAASRVKLRDAASGADMPAANTFGTIQIPRLPGVPEFELTIPQPAPTGVAYQRYTKLGTVEEELRLEPVMISYKTSSYERWSNVTHIVESAIFPVLKDYLSEVPYVLGLIIQYIDLFYADTDGDQDCSELFCPNSKWLVSSLTKKRTMWHSHCGLFEDVAEGSRRLINVNVDVSDRKPPRSEASYRSVAILTLCSDQFLDNHRPVDIESFPSEARTRFNSLHDRSKQLLSEVLSTAYQDRIGLKLETGS
jgi:hypothetical protein